MADQKDGQKVESSAAQWVVQSAAMLASPTAASTAASSGTSMADQLANYSIWSMVKSSVAKKVGNWAERMVGQ